jgi:hypothetical protein
VANHLTCWFTVYIIEYQQIMHGSSETDNFHGLILLTNALRRGCTKGHGIHYTLFRFIKFYLYPLGGGGNMSVLELSPIIIIVEGGGPNSG